MVHGNKLGVSMKELILSFNVRKAAVNTGAGGNRRSV